MQQVQEIAVTFRGKDLTEVISQAEQFIAVTSGGPKTTTTAAPAKRAKKTAPPTEEIEETFLAGEEELETEALADDEELGFDSPVEAKPAAKQKKISDKDLNAAAMAYAKVNGRPATLELLKKHFKTQSVLEIKPADYVKALKLLKV